MTPDGGEAAPAEPRAARRLRYVLGAATAGMVVLTWPLWVEGGEVPRVPFVRGVPAAGGVWGWVPAAVLAGTTLMTAVMARWRPWFAASVGAFTLSWLGDQHRFQPWAYQYAMTGLMLAGLPGGRGLRLARWWFVALYLHSGLSKLDVPFCEELGARFLATGLRPFGLDTAGWPAAARYAAVGLMPAGEVATAVALAVPGWRRWGLAGATFLHLALLGILGPWGLGHSALVLAWNAAMLVEVWVAFADPAGGAGGSAPAGFAWRAAGAVTAGAFAAGAVLPLGERWGVCDAWPAHALYASHVERLTVDLHATEADGYPPSVRRHLRDAPDADGPWKRFDLTGWSREARGAPVYPQNRAGLGLAEGLAARYGGPGPGPGLVRVTLYGPAGRWSLRRSRTELIGLEAVRRWGDRFTLNAHPAGRTPAASAPPTTTERSE